MYVVLVNEDNSLIATNKERIMQRSKLVDTLWFLVAPEYKGYNMADFTVLIEYILPVSREYHSDTLVLSEESYNGYLKYHVPFDTNLTAEAGTIEVQLTFALADLDENGNPVQRVRKIAPPLEIEIVPISAWSDIIPDSALTALDQRLIKADAQIKELADISDMLSDSKADNLRYNTQNGELQLVAGNKAIGNKVTIISCASEDTDGDRDKDGIPVVEF